MKPYVVCHMVASIDGRILHSRWRPRTRDGGDLFERLHGRIGGEVESVAGERQSFAAGDAFVVPAGFEGTWTVHEECVKFYAIFEPRA